MFSIPRVVKLSQAGEFERVLEEALRSSRLLPLPVRLRLSEPVVVAAAAAGLALKRIVELTYKPTPATAVMTELLLVRQRADGSFGGAAATAIAAAALDAVARQADSLAGYRGGLEHLPDDLRARLAAALDHALAALGSMTAMFGGRLGARGLGGGAAALDPMDAAIVLWQVAGSPRLASAVGADELLATAERAGLFHDRAAAPLLERFTSIRPARAASGDDEAPLWDRGMAGPRSRAAAA